MLDQGETPLEMIQDSGDFDWDKTNIRTVLEKYNLQHRYDEVVSDLESKITDYIQVAQVHTIR